MATCHKQCSAAAVLPNGPRAVLLRWLCCVRGCGLLTWLVVAPLLLVTPPIVACGVAIMSLLMLPIGFALALGGALDTASELGA